MKKLYSLLFFILLVSCDNKINDEPIVEKVQKYEIKVDNTHHIQDVSIADDSLSIWVLTDLNKISTNDTSFKVGNKIFELN